MVNDGKNMAGMVSENVQACGDGFCDRAAREQAKMKAAIHERMRAADEVRVPPGTPMLGLDAATSKNPLCLPGCGVETPKNRCVHEFGCIVAAQENRKAREEAAVERANAQLAKEFHAPGKQFTRSDILAILRAQRAVAGNVADSEYQKLLSIFENLE